MPNLRLSRRALAQVGADRLGRVLLQGPLGRRRTSWWTTRTCSGCTRRASDSIGCTSKPYGPARVEVHDESGALVASALTNTHNHCAISGLQANTRYTYTVTVKHELWGAGVRWDWDPQAQGLVQRDGVYRNEFRTLPDPQQPLAEPFSFIVIGDFGVGMRKPSTATKRQLRGRAGARARGGRSTTPGWSSRPATTSTRRNDSCSGPATRATKTTTGSSPTSSRIATCSTGSRCARRSATTTRARPRSTTTASRSWTTCTCASGSPARRLRDAHRSSPGCSTDSARRPTSSSSASTRRRRISSAADGSTSIRSTGSSSRRRFRRPARTAVRWRIPFGHHPPYCAGPQHHNTRGMETADRAVPSQRRAGALQRPRAQLPALDAGRDRLLRLRRRREDPAAARRTDSKRRGR